MQDRVSLHPGRVKLVPVAGQENTYDMVRADSPTQDGTPLNKDTLLKDATAALYGLGADAVPDDAFISLTNCFAQILVTTSPNTEVTASLNGKTVSATADSSGLAILKIPGFGTWTISATVNGASISFDYEIKAIAQYEIALSTGLETTSWEVIDSISKSGNASSIWSVGDKKIIKLDGVSYTAQIIGFNHDTKTSGGKAGITFQLVDCLNVSYKMNLSDTNVGGWKSSSLRSRMSEFLGQLDEDLQSVIKAVNKRASVGNKTSTIETVSDKLFLLSEVEIFGSTTYSFTGEGSQYAYYKAGNTKVKKVNGSVKRWWERSPSSRIAGGFCDVYDDGTAANSKPTYDEGVSFGFCV